MHELFPSWLLASDSFSLVQSYSLIPSLSSHGTRLVQSSIEDWMRKWSQSISNDRSSEAWADWWLKTNLYLLLVAVTIFRSSQCSWWSLALAETCDMCSKWLQNNTYPSKLRKIFFTDFLTHTYTHYTYTHAHLHMQAAKRQIYCAERS